MTGTIQLLWLMADVVALAAAFIGALVWVRLPEEASIRRRNARKLMAVYAASVTLLWILGLLVAGYALGAAMIFGALVAGLHIVFVTILVWLAAKGTPPAPS
jgi:hypothetical protein